MDVTFGQNRPISSIGLQNRPFFIFYLKNQLKKIHFLKNVLMDDFGRTKNILITFRSSILSLKFYRI